MRCPTNPATSSASTSCPTQIHGLRIDHPIVETVEALRCALGIEAFPQRGTHLGRQRASCRIVEINASAAARPRPSPTAGKANTSAFPMAPASSVGSTSPANRVVPRMPRRSACSSSAPRSGPSPMMVSGTSLPRSLRRATASSTRSTRFCATRRPTVITPPPPALRRDNRTRSAGIGCTSMASGSRFATAPARSARNDDTAVTAAAPWSTRRAIARAIPDRSRMATSVPCSVTT